MKRKKWCRKKTTMRKKKLKREKKEFSKNSFFPNVVKIQSIRLCEVKMGYADIHTGEAKKKQLTYAMENPWGEDYYYFFCCFFLLRSQFYGHFKQFGGGGGGGFYFLSLSLSALSYTLSYSIPFYSILFLFHMMEPYFWKCEYYAYWRAFMLTSTETIIYNNGQKV